MAEIMATETVADLLKQRDNCRDGLQGLAMKHIPTGIEFICYGSAWADDRNDMDELELLIYPKRLRQEEPPSTPLGNGFVMVCMADVKYDPDWPTLRADECALLDPWPRRR